MSEIQLKDLQGLHERTSEKAITDYMKVKLQDFQIPHERQTEKENWKDLQLHET